MITAVARIDSRWRCGCIRVSVRVKARVKVRV